MKATVQTYPCNEGDCIFMKMQDEKTGESFHLMIDCGALSKEIIDYIENEFHLRIDLLIATHIDCDHIDGITAMFYEDRLKDLQIQKILYNCYQGQAIDERIKADQQLLNVVERIKDVVGYPSDSKISVKTSVSLGAILSNSDDLKKIWNKEAVTENTPSIDLGKQWGKIYFLAPSKNAIEALYLKFKEAYASIAGVKIPDTPYDNIEELYELLAKLDSQRKRAFRGKKISDNSCLDESSVLAAKLEDSCEGLLTLANKASLAFVWECNGHRVLFMGDAPSSIVTKNLRKLYGEAQQVYDAVKISHHGSKYNTSSDFCSIVDSHVYYLTGGSEDVGHDIEAIAKLLIRNCGDGFSRTLRYNVETNFIKNLKYDSTKELRDKYHFDLIGDTDNTPYVFEY